MAKTYDCSGLETMGGRRECGKKGKEIGEENTVRNGLYRSLVSCHY